LRLSRPSESPKLTRLYTDEPDRAFAVLPQRFPLGIESGYKYSLLAQSLGIVVHMHYPQYLFLDRLT
jgi:hypothetical protein